jgi:esterase/lipase superfamily enzyme
VEFVARGELTTVDVPPPGAEPPAAERVVTAAGPSGYLRYRWGAVGVFYATDRRRTGSRAVENFYGADESEDGALELGRLEVSVPRVHRPGLVERPIWYRLERTTDPNKHMVVRDIRPLGEAVFLDSLRQAVGRSGGKEALVFIHGYNVTFHEAALRAAQLTYDLSFDGAPILYSWPSKGSLFRYSADRESAEWSASHLAGFLQSVVAVTGAKQVHVIAHSMGNLVLVQALAKVAASPVRDTLFANLVLAAPDVPLNLFQQQLAPAIRPLARRLTIYMSGRDKALWASRLLSTHLRLGEATDPMVVVRDTDTIDASTASTDALGHGYIASSKDLIDDLVLLLGQKRPPPRSRLRAASASGGAYWRFP